MNYRPALENEQTSQITDASVEVTAVFVEFRTGDKRAAGTDAAVFLRLGQQTFPMPEEHGKNPFERGATDRFAFALDPPITLGALRQTEIEVYHDSGGRNPGWLVAGVRLWVRLSGRESSRSCTRSGTTSAGSPSTRRPTARRSCCSRQARMISEEATVGSRAWSPREVTRLVAVAVVIAGWVGGHGCASSSGG